MSKLLVLLLVILVVLWVFHGLGRKARSRRSAPAQQGRGEDMVRCAQCGLHLPRSESLTQDAVFFCSVEHRRAHERAR